nr:hypothetical protein GCM10020092_094780 [Actinoplanes digitatis]
MPADRLATTESAWRRSRRCVGESHCVEFKAVDGGAGLRNSRSPETVLTFDGVEWQHFIDGLKSGELRLAH